MKTSYYKHHIDQSADSAYWTKVWRNKSIDSKYPAPKDTPVPITSSIRDPDDNNRQRKVHFSDVSVREYEIQPSDTPAVSAGAGIELGWKYKTLIESTPLIDFDEQRSKQRTKYFQYSPGLSPLQRRIRLSEFGFSKDEIDEASARAAILRRSNEKSVRRMRFDRVAELGEGLGRNWKHMKAKMGVCQEEKSDDIDGRIPHCSSKRKNDLDFNNLHK